MPFVKYSSLENHTNSKFLEKIVEAITLGYCDNHFVAREKIHGTNFSVIITKDSIQPAKRSGPISETESFFGWQDLMAKYRKSFEVIQEKLIAGEYKQEIEGSPGFVPSVTVEKVQIFGEYAGGGIQKEVDYGEKDFYAFDVMFDDKYINDVAATGVASVAGLKMAPIIAIGTLEELLKLPVEFNTTVPTYNKLWDEAGNGFYDFVKPEAPTDNVGEGLVIKPVVPAFLGNGSRIAIKYKTDAFKEKGKGKAPKLPTPMTDKDIALATQFSEFITENRLSNVLSHIGEVTAKDFGKVMGLMMKDIFAEAKREEISIDVADSPSKVSKEIQHQVTTLIRSKWVDIISN
ncbi:RnlB RNA ligase 2 [Acinetobacter phage Ac42]|uniref:RNA ligase n=1 Tax=Acinetobacter phage Ac42 TaxID=762660 RepID=UPI0001EBCC6C|nr:RNA ligase [Acinetobacter phage Ac42]ADI96248.1 RnlB RNA ligase 2 [Acinetobacter phage Ac42]